MKKWVLVIVLAAMYTTYTDAKVSELRKDVNRVSQVQLRCADAIAYGYYTPQMMNQCIDDYIHSGGDVEPDLP